MPPNPIALAILDLMVGWHTDKIVQNSKNFSKFTPVFHTTKVITICLQNCFINEGLSTAP